MTAEEARKLTHEYLMEQVGLKYKADSLDQRIKDAAMKGSTQIKVDIDKFESKIRAPFFYAIKSEYEAKGFMVKRVTGRDYDHKCWRGVSVLTEWDYILISW